jgi:hypothetical protein
VVERRRVTSQSKYERVEMFEIGASVTKVAKTAATVTMIDADHRDLPDHESAVKRPLTTSSESP